jgi:hypothetical protein
VANAALMQGRIALNVYDSSKGPHVYAALLESRVLALQRELRLHKRDSGLALHEITLRVDAMQHPHRHPSPLGTGWTANWGFEPIQQDYWRYASGRLLIGHAFNRLHRRHRDG